MRHAGHRVGWHKEPFEIERNEDPTAEKLQAVVTTLLQFVCRNCRGLSLQYGLSAKTVRLEDCLGLRRLGRAFMFIVQMNCEGLPHIFAFCLDRSLEQRLLNFRHEFTPAPRNGLSQSPVNLFSGPSIGGAVIGDFAGRVQLCERYGQGLILRSTAAMRKKNVDRDFRNHSPRRAIRLVTHNELAVAVSPKIPPVAVRTRVKIPHNSSSHNVARLFVHRSSNPICLIHGSNQAAGLISARPLPGFFTLRGCAGLPASQRCPAFALPSPGPLLLHRSLHLFVPAWLHQQLRMALAGSTYLQLGSSRYRSCRGRGANSKSFAVWERQKNLSSSGEKQLPKLTCQPEILEGSRPGTSRAVGENAELDGIIQNVASKIVNDGHMLVSDIGWLNKWCSEMGRAGSYSQATSGEGPLLNHNRQRFAVGEGLHSNRVSSNRRLCFRETEFCAQRQRRRNIRRSSQGLAGRDEANATTRQLRASYRTAGKSLRKSECVVGLEGLEPANKRL
jgi:hypothetical protein